MMIDAQSHGHASPTSLALHHSGEEMAMKKIEMEIRSTKENGKWMAAAIVNGEKKAAHLMEMSEHCFGGLRTVGGNPARYFRPDDELWWLNFFDGAESVRITGELCEA